jgi:hypothetical protein
MQALSAFPGERNLAASSAVTSFSFVCLRVTQTEDIYKPRLLVRGVVR